MKLPTKAGAVIRWKYKYDGAYQYQVAVLTPHPDYEQGLAWSRDGYTTLWLPDEMQKRVESSDWGEWEILSKGDETGTKR